MTTIEEQTLEAIVKENIPFVYIDSSLSRSNDDDDEQHEGCSCPLDSTCSNCSCVTRFGRNYHSSKCLNLDQHQPIFECNSECSCSLETCENRLSQQGDLSEKVKIISTPGKGFGVFSKECFPRPGTFVGEYVGEVLSEDEARQRMINMDKAEHNYLLLYNEHQADRVIKTFVDARYYGNWTRFINHSCDPNLHIVPIRIDQPWPSHLAFFTRRTIDVGEELSYSYGTEIDLERSKVCHCSSSSCRAFLPYQQRD